MVSQTVLTGVLSMIANGLADAGLDPSTKLPTSTCDLMYLAGALGLSTYGQMDWDSTECHAVYVAFPTPELYYHPFRREDDLFPACLGVIAEYLLHRPQGPLAAFTLSELRQCREYVVSTVTEMAAAHVRDLRAGQRAGTESFAPAFSDTGRGCIATRCL